MHGSLGSAYEPRPRIETLDILRGFAILGILFVNIPFMGNTIANFEDARVLGWTAADRGTWLAIETFLEGTQRGLLELLFGATALILVGKAVLPTDPIRVADIYYRRTFWLIFFGMVHATVLLWPGDILFTYGLAGLLLFPMRRLKARTLALIGAAGLLAAAAVSLPSYLSEVQFHSRAAAAEQKQAQGARLSAAERQAIAQRREAQTSRFTAEERRKEREARLGGYAANFGYLVGWTKRLSGGLFLLMSVAEAAFTMMIGMALFKWDALQGERPRRFYFGLMMAGYGIGLPLNFIEAQSRIAAGFGSPDWTAITYDVSRLATTLGHVGLVVLIATSPTGARLLRPLQAPGRMALTTYLSQTVIGMFILFSGFGLGLWGRFGWAELAGTAGAVILLQLLLSNLWLRYFEMGPAEWLWRWLTYGSRPYLRRRPGGSATTPIGQPATAPSIL